MAEEAFTAGLLHDIGKLALADNPSLKYLELMARAQAENQRLIEVERETFQATHADVGAYLLDLWGLPAPLIEAVAFHHEPSRVEEAEFNSLTAVHVANALEHQSQETAPCLELDAEYLTRLNLTDRLEAWGEEMKALD